MSALTLAAAATIQGLAGSAASITISIFGDEKTTSADVYKKLYQGQLPAVAGILYTVPASTNTIVSAVILANTTAGAVVGTLFVDGTGDTNRIVRVSIPANGEAVWAGDGWKVLDANGAELTTSAIVLTGDVTGSGAGSVVTTIAANAVDNTKLADVATSTFKGRTTGGTGDPEDLTVAQAKTLLNLAGTNTGDQNLFASVTGTSGTATADSTTDNLAITGANGISTAATDTPDGLVITGANAFGVVTGTTGTATADTSGDTIAITGANGISTAATDTPDGLVITGPNIFATVTGNTGTATPDSATDSLSIVGSGALTTVVTDGPEVVTVSVVNNGVTNAMLAQAPTLTLKGNNTGGTANVADLTLTQLAAMGVTGLSRWIDVTKQALPVLTTNTAAQNITAINAILAAADTGSTIYIPGGTYNFNAAWTMPSKQFVFQGQGSNLTGGYTILAWTSNVAGNFITLANSIWYSQFRDLNFVSAGVTQTAGAVVDINGNAGTNFFNCSFSATGGGFLFDVLKGDKVGTGIQDQSWNSAVISGCAINSFKGKAIFVNSAASSLVVEKCVINGAWGGFTGSPAALQATAGIEGRWVGALQVIACDILGCVNNLLLDPVSASSEVCASVVVTNCYFDNAGGSCVKITGTGSTVRCRFTACYFTTAGTNYSTPGTGLSAIEINGTATYAAGGQSIAFTDCNIYDTFSTAGTANGVLIAGNWADVYFNGCNVSGWTNGYNVTPTAGNISNLKVTGGACGPSGGLGLNAVGFLIGAGAYKGLQIQSCNAAGNTTNLTLGAVTVPANEGSQYRITDNTGINPRGAVTTPAVPATGVAVANTTGFRVSVAYKSTGTVGTSITLNGVVTSFPAINSLVHVQLDPGGTIAWAGGTAPTWVWVGQ